MKEGSGSRRRIQGHKFTDRRWRKNFWSYDKASAISVPIMSSNLQTLLVRGHVFGTITKINVKLSREALKKSAFLYLAETRAQTSSTKSQDADLDTTETPIEDQMEFENYINEHLYEFFINPCEIQGEVQEGNIETPVFLNRKGREGRVGKAEGWVHQSAVVGDKLCIMKGCSVPVDLRPRPEGGYFVIGDAFSNGFTWQDAIERLKEHDWVDLELH
jgi:hypothetical protein